MLIVSKFHDYYDPVAKSKGVDKTIVYTRETKPWVDCPKIELLRHSERYSRGDNRVLDFYTYVIGFCGKLYPIGLLQTNSTSKAILFHSFESIKNAYVSLYGRHDRGKGTRVIKSYNTQWTNREINKLSDALQNKQLLEAFQRYKTPIFVYSEPYARSIPIISERALFNPKLKDFEFVKVVDPYQAFQELEMFISGVLGVGEHQTVKVSDKSKIIEHGFDYKWSFRKEPTKRSKKSC